MVKSNSFCLVPFQANKLTNLFLFVTKIVPFGSSYILFFSFVVLLIYRENPPSFGKNDPKGTGCNDIPAGHRCHVCCCWQESGCIGTGIQILMWPIMFLIFLPVLTLSNLVIWMFVYGCRGGAIGVAKSGTQPYCTIMRLMFSEVSVQNCIEIQQKLDGDKAKKCFSKYAQRNHYIEGKHVILEVFDIDDTVTKAQIYRKWKHGMRRPASHHHTWLLISPSRTFICGCTDFGIYDGTSSFNWLKGFVQTYYDGEDKAPLVRPKKGNKELDLKLDASTVLPDGTTMGARLGCCTGLKVVFKTSFRSAILMGRNILSREILDFFLQSPKAYSAIATIAPELNTKMTNKIQTDGNKMFAHFLQAGGRACNELATTNKVLNPLLATQVSTQTRYYKPLIKERNVVGNWLIPLGGQYNLKQLGNRAWCETYYKDLIKDIKNFDNKVAEAFINQTVFGFFGAGAWTNPRKIFWYNNYGLRSMHPDAGDLTYHWGPNYTASCYCFVNIVTVNGSTCITISSAKMNQHEVNQIAQNVRTILLEGITDDTEQKV